MSSSEQPQAPTNGEVNTTTGVDTPPPREQTELSRMFENRSITKWRIIWEGFRLVCLIIITIMVACLISKVNFDSGPNDIKSNYKTILNIFTNVLFLLIPILASYFISDDKIKQTFGDLIFLGAHKLLSFPSMVEARERVMISFVRICLCIGLLDVGIAAIVIEELIFNEDSK
ncbi:putative membrane protein [Wickerhamomyces ciferrii]|uniref:Membrane protein n=1 Tax=Wickerhamomyces ciferrii (strain ATCC 14091 / BCRC 22168 / CBS 111 / JCM 3599 / NBRC 0793 / NRRL Y-1031 F-60-10) TaxID=1206466 RepID=K0KT09_WICCF|nr:uncharacterized protein BN7_4763 [Wickerhamomyces ciferrii]CCH45182.1 putative membrane protein [Wickerhamomyces ciferrii]